MFQQYLKWLGVSFSMLIFGKPKLHSRMEAILEKKELSWTTLFQGSEDYLKRWSVLKILTSHSVTDKLVILFFHLPAIQWRKGLPESMRYFVIMWPHRTAASTVLDRQGTFKIWLLTYGQSILLLYRSNGDNFFRIQVEAINICTRMAGINYNCPQTNQQVLSLISQEE